MYDASYKHGGRRVLDVGWLVGCFRKCISVVSQSLQTSTGVIVRCYEISCIAELYMGFSYLTLVVNIYQISILFEGKLIKDVFIEYKS